MCSLLDVCLTNFAVSASSLSKTDAAKTLTSFSNTREMQLKYVKNVPIFN